MRRGLSIRLVILTQDALHTWIVELDRHAHLACCM
jgi:hypothetical protein